MRLLQLLTCVWYSQKSYSNVSFAVATYVKGPGRASLPLAVVTNADDLFPPSLSFACVFPKSMALFQWVNKMIPTTAKMNKEINTQKINNMGLDSRNL